MKPDPPPYFQIPLKWTMGGNHRAKPVGDLPIMDLDLIKTGAERLQDQLQTLNPWRRLSGVQQIGVRG